VLKSAHSAMVSGLFVPLDYLYRGWTIRTLDDSYDGLFVPWTVRTTDVSYYGLFVPYTNIPYVTKVNVYICVCLYRCFILCTCIALLLAL